MPQYNKGEDFGKITFTCGHHCLHPRGRRNKDGSFTPFAIKINSLRAAVKGEG